MLDNYKINIINKTTILYCTCYIKMKIIGVNNVIKRRKMILSRNDMSAYYRVPKNIAINY